jgi:hypothetical protein
MIFSKGLAFRLMAGPCVVMLVRHPWSEWTISLYAKTANFYADMCDFFFCMVVLSRSKM